MSQYVLRAIAFANGQECPVAGQYVRSFNADAYGGQGYVDFTHSPKEAKKFNTAQEAFRYWRTVSNVKPLREDGLPNRPLTSTTMSIELVS